MNYALTKDSEIHSTHESEQDAYYKLQRVQGFSADYAINHNGWNVVELVSRSTVKSVKQAFQNHILDVIEHEFEGSEKEKLEYLIDRFQGEYVYPDNLKRYGSHQEMFKNWMLGGAMAFEFENYKILEFMESVGMPKPKDKDMKQAADKYYHLIYRELNSLLRKNGLELF